MESTTPKALLLQIDRMKQGARLLYPVVILALFAMGLATLLGAASAHAQTTERICRDLRSPTWPYPGLIPDLGTITDEIVIGSQTGEIVDVDVEVDIEHTWVGDLEIALSHSESGITQTLIDRPGVSAVSSLGCAGDDIVATIDDEASVAAETMCNMPPPAIAVSGPVIGGDPPDNTLLSGFDGSDGMGTWTLAVSDRVFADIGWINEWCLVLTVVPYTDVVNSDLVDNLDVGPGDTVLITGGATVSGNLAVDGGGVVIENGSVIEGNVEATNGGTVIIRGGSDVDGNVDIKVSGAESVLEVSNSSISGNIQTEGSGSVTIVGSYVDGNISFMYDGEVTITDNTVNGNIEIEGPEDCTESNNDVSGNNSGCP